MTRQPLSLAFFLPQFHAIPENDLWWGPGFTEWTQLAKWQPSHAQHRIRRPVAPWGCYHLLDPDVLVGQSKLAREHGVDAFLFWDYWFGDGVQLLNKPIDLRLAQGLDVPHALAWANHDWTDKRSGRVLMRQRYLGAADYERYFQRSLPHLASPQYVKVDGRPVFFVYRPHLVPDLDVFIATWRRLASAHGLKGLYLIADLPRSNAPHPPGFDACSCTSALWENRHVTRPVVLAKTLLRRLGRQPSPQRFNFDQLLKGVASTTTRRGLLHTVFTGWDTTPRHGRNGVIVDGLDAAAFRRHLQDIRAELDGRPPPSVILVKSWNEWAEGNVLEPDSIHGMTLLNEYKAFADALPS